MGIRAVDRFVIGQKSSDGRPTQASGDGANPGWQASTTNVQAKFHTPTVPLSISCQSTQNDKADIFFRCRFDDLFAFHTSRGLVDVHYF